MTNQMITVEAINACLPQTQCRLCEYQDCLSYAQAIAQGEQLHLCQPGGERTLKALEQVCQRQAEQPVIEHQDHVVVINEQVCIGCYKCVNACPVSAIVGAAKKMHSVIASDCTGCNLCIPVCPVDCILPVPQKNPLDYYAGAALDQTLIERKNTYQQHLHKQEQARTTRAQKKKEPSLLRPTNTIQMNSTGTTSSDITKSQQMAGRQSYQIARINKAINTCKKNGDTAQREKLEKQLADLTNN